ncbi:MAG TPA: N-6 DNA methylase [Candidatus Dojkabacteria bacterium]|nr:N-6 DNA methylase [Candidatus Dojkabacteria bacterium]HQF36320.1 N-6 DNA methylase [Candidatus Dojkabacteria bacterium]
MDRNLQIIIYILAFGTQILLLIIAVILIIYIFYLLRNLRDNQNVPFVPSSRKVINTLVKSNLINEKSRICEIGCGTGSVLINIAKKCNPQKCVGLEKKKIVYLLAQLNLLFNNSVKNSTTIICEDIKNYPINEFSVIYIFMTEKFIKDELLPKFKKELKPGTIIFSNMFEIPFDPKIKLINKIPVEKIMGTSKMSYLRLYEVKK